MSGTIAILKIIAGINPNGILEIIGPELTK